MSDVEIRPADKADLAVLIGTFGDEDFFTDRLARQWDGRGILLTAWTPKQELIGDVYLWMEPAEEPELRAHLPGVPLLNHVEIHPDHRNRGFGTDLVYKAEQLLAENGHERVALAVRIDNPHAYRLYLRLGYVRWPHPPVECKYEVRLPDGTIKLCYETCYVMVKVLRDNGA